MIEALESQLSIKYTLSPVQRDASTITPTNKSFTDQIINIGEENDRFLAMVSIHRS